jgi:glucans biosynthesis protein
VHSVNRRWTLAALLAALPSLAHGAPPPAAAGGWPREVPLGPPQPFSFDRLKGMAGALAARPYRPRPRPLIDQVHAVDYDAFGQVIYRPSATLWTDGPPDQAVRFFPIGRASPKPVAMHVVSGGQARQIPYSPALFDMPADSPFRALGDAAGFGGFRVLNADRATDWVAFLGASYFRAADPFNQYGLSARGLAIDTAAPRPEEFPDFTSFWIEHARNGALVVYALLEGPSVTGAYRIVHNRSRAGLVQEITAALRFRRPVERLGIAPLTSMYWYGQSDRTPDDDWRPQIHDSDGLAIWTGAGERIWRPLRNPARVSTHAFVDKSPRGFGLLQRNRRFADYQDDGVFYERRPSAWVEPLGDWGPGSVQLVEIPTRGETDDNIVAFWTPARPVRAGTRLELRYRLHWTDEEPHPVGVARVVATRAGQGGRPGVPILSGRRKYVIDFAGGALSGLTDRGAAEAVVSATQGRPVDAVAYPVVGQGLWRLMFDLESAPAEADLRAYLRRGGEALTETWMYSV